MAAFSRVLGVAAIAFTFLVGTASGDSSEKRIIRLAATCTAINDFVDIGLPGPTPGDQYVFVEELFSANRLTRLGEAYGRCSLVDPQAGLFACSIISSFAGGTITTEGLLRNVPGVVNVGAITGGTGAFRGATGEGTVELGSACGPHNVAFFLSRQRPD